MATSGSAAAVEQEDVVGHKALTLGVFAGQHKFAAALLAPLMTALGAEADDELEIVADIPQETLDEALGTMKKDGEDLTAMDKGRVVNFMKKIRAHGKAVETPAPIVTEKEPGVEAHAPTPKPDNKRKMSIVLDQADDGTFESLSVWERKAMRTLHRDTTGDDPVDTERPSSDQLALLRTKIDSGAAPYADFALWGPFGKRLVKLRKFDAQVS